MDPIVRIQAGRLRRSLERYYLMSGAGDPVRFESSGPELEPAISSLKEQLCVEMGHYGDVRVVRRRELDQLGSAGDHGDFELLGRVSFDDGAPHVTARLLDARNASQVWAEDYRGPANATNAFYVETGRAVAARVASEHGWIGWLLALLGDWERGTALIRRSIERNPGHIPVALHALWADHLRRGELEEAHDVALRFNDSTFFWRALMRATSLGLLGRKAEAKREAAELLRQKPDFAKRGRTLIGRYIKFPELHARIVGGLAKAGLALD